MNRRRFLTSLGASSTFVTARPAARIKRIALASVDGRFHKFVAMNSYDKAPKGHTYENTLVRVGTDAGVEGVGVMSYAGPDTAFTDALRGLIGADPVALYEHENGRITGRATAHADLLRRYKHLDGPLLDLIGKLTGRAVWQLIGDGVRDRIEVYDGTLYFSDIWFRDRGVAAVVEECQEAQGKGYGGVKLKLGRGWKWMERESGLIRDIAVVLAVRKAMGPRMKVLADANNGYQGDFARAWKLMQGTAEAKLFWMEEIFSESVQQYTELRAKMRSAGIETLIADGESAHEVADFTPYLRPQRLMDVVQLDIRTGGILENLALARMAEAAGAVSVPHNWGSQVGMLMGLHVAKAVKTVIAAEDDRSTCDAIIPEGYEFRDGGYSVPDAPGLSIRVNEDVYRLKCKPKEIVIT